MNRSLCRAPAAVRAVAMLAAWSLAGCATAPPGEDDWIRGRLSVRVDATAQRDASALAAEFELRGNDVDGELRLTGAIGARLAQARWSEHEARLDAGQGEVRFADLESLSREAFGEVLPLRALPDWLAGRPWGRADSRRIDGGFEQLGWTVSSSGPTGTRIEAVRAAPPRVVVRVVLERPRT